MAEKLYNVKVEREIADDGRFHRQDNQFKTPFGDGPDDLKAEAGRYRLYWETNCQWSNRSSIVAELLGLGDAIEIIKVGRADVNGTYAWTVCNEDGSPDEVSGYTYLYEFYNATDPDFEGRATVPAIIDKQTCKVATNYTHELTYYLEEAFKPFHKEGAPDLLPAGLRDEIIKFNDWLFPEVNDGPYKMMFARSLEAYEEAEAMFLRNMDYLDKRLETQRFLFGDYVTDSDVRLFTTLARYETCYYRFLGPMVRGLRGYKNLWDYARDLYEIPAFRNNTDFRHFARYYGAIDESKAAFRTYNYRFWNEADYERKWSEPQNRHQLSKDPYNKLLVR